MTLHISVKIKLIKKNNGYDIKQYNILLQTFVKTLASHFDFLGQS